MTAGSGIAAALAAPFLLDVGFLIWDKHWLGSSFALNLYKCSIASVGFLILSLVTRPPGATQDDGPFPSEIFTVQSVGSLMLSSTVGILIGDWTWLEALQLIGAKKVVLMDSFKPFLAAFFGWWILGERLAWPAFIGMALTVGGVIWVSLEREQSEDGTADESVEVNADTASEGENRIRNSTSSDGFEDDAISATMNKPPDIDIETETDASSTTKNCEKVLQRIRCCKGYALAVANVFLDTYGSLLTRQYGVGMSTWNIALIRFGFSAAFCIVLSSILHLRDVMVGSNVKRKTEPPTSVRASVLQLLEYRLGKDIGTCTPTERVEREPSDTSDPGEEECSTTKNQRPWYSLPKMERRSWLLISLGVAFTTFATPALTNYALFQIALALALTLGSIGPVYMVPLAWLIKKERPSLRSFLGAILAVAGVAILSFFGR